MVSPSEGRERRCTGTAAANFAGGKTLHSLLSIYPRKNKKKNEELDLEPLTATPLLRLQREFEDTEILVIGNICSIIFEKT